MSEANLLQQKITFYQNSADIKEQIAKSENDRLKLEIELNKLVNSEDSIAKSKAVKLKTYYTKLCDDEAKSIKRNQQILTDLQRVDSQFQQLESKLERLTNLKKECEIYLRTAYPKWSSDNKVALSQEQLDNRGAYSLNQGIGLIAENLQRIDQLKKSKLNDLYRDESLLSKLDKSFTETKSNKTPLLEAVSLFTGTSHQENETSKKASIISNLIATPPIAKQYDSKKEAINNPFDSPIRQLAQSFTAKEPTNTINNNAAEFGSTMGMNNLIKEYEREIKRQDSNPIDMMNSVTTSNNFMNILNDANTTVVIANNENKNGNPAERLDRTITIEDNKHNVEEQNIELDIDGLFHLFDYVELEMKHIMHHENYYRQSEVSQKSKNEIIRLAMNNRSLNEMDSLSVSMVIRSQMPNLINNYTTQSCLFNSGLLDLNISEINDSLIRTVLRNKQDLNLWDRLLRHFVILRKMAMIDSLSIAQIFAPTLINDSRMIEKAVKFLEKIINLEVNQLDLMSDSLTETSINKELQLASSSKLKHSSAYQQFILSSTQNSNKSKEVENDSDDDNDEIDALVALKNGVSTINESSKGNIIVQSILKSPRKKSDVDFDYSQSLRSDKNSSGIKTLESLRSSKDKKLPVHLRDFDDSEDESEESEANNTKKNTNSLNTIKLDNDFDFYN